MSWHNAMLPRKNAENAPTGCLKTACSQPGSTFIKLSGTIVLYLFAIPAAM
jgi:hypothetical protein